MAIRFRVLGGAGRDNALHVEVDSGHAIRRLLFDCGDGCLSGLAQAEVQAIDHLFFSHFHMDHVSGFDGYFRTNFDREARPNRIWGPPGSGRILQHRFQSYLWNLHEDLSATWKVSDIDVQEVRTWRYELREAFERAHEEAAVMREGALVLDEDEFTVEALTMDHRTPCLAYRVTEKTRWNIDPAGLAALGLRPGAWLKALKDPAETPDEAWVEGWRAGELRERLLVPTPGDSVAYLTDFLMNEEAMERLADWLAGCGTLICESQYRAADLELAQRNYHMTSLQGAALAERVRANELVLIHVSARYTREEWAGLLDEARGVFPAARFPETWG
ncbi:MAG: ribonuclease Z [Verrucomicrobia bacterium]|nr:MAG: ribonuclease Z [Verrucomicrobiota bacterium]TAE88887.1 MAG: ribonuclease Z [Verrucomicrobiota bacterium]TAF27304.1 MAG: ribonuclease Z [Verrucomicrobiota bacterium]TAF42405.1 MAG: ribonuclease Z [Verrucomicrobiota bacterium]